MVKMVTEVLKFIVDAITMCPIFEHQGKCLQFASACIQVIIPTLRKHSHGLAQLSEDLKGTLLCLKSSFTYATKLLNVVLKNYDDTSSPLPEAFTLANNLLNLVTSIESYFGSKNARCLIPAIKPWVLDLILALGSSHLLTNTPHDRDPSIISQNSLCFFPWLKVLGKLEFLDMNAHNEDEEASSISAVNKFSVFKDIIEMVVVVLRHNSKVLDSVGIIFLIGLATLLEREEYGLALGIVHFVCVKLVRHEHGEWEDLRLMLASLQELFPQIKNSIKDSTSEEGRKVLESAEAFLEPVWTAYVSEYAGDQ
ncbi:Condensin-2 complex subunit g2 [Thalictrum thalictroides]|uniref:Condensin-2 complex subunit g2 n=1 Tax=Thalictrum thalictroides TaxID=46969 RepID=A0A7J6V041_THATH|nr:Condensin-2 complex subunit g2 [Thalictrum thalictroides]